MKLCVSTSNLELKVWNWGREEVSVGLSEQHQKWASPILSMEQCCIVMNSIPGGRCFLTDGIRISTWPWKWSPFISNNHYCKFQLYHRVRFKYQQIIFFIFYTKYRRSNSTQVENLDYKWYSLPTYFATLHFCISLIGGSLLSLKLKVMEHSKEAFCMHYTLHVQIEVGIQAYT